MHKTIAFFNHKGGVSKTTTTFNVGWMLAEQGHRVLMVDADPQCNLTGLVCDYDGEGRLDSYYDDYPEQNIHDALAPAFESQPAPITTVRCVPVPGRKNLSLLAGHVNLSEYEVTLGIAQELSGSIHALRNLPGACVELIRKVATAESASYVLIDMNPSLGSINQNLLMTSDYFLVPTAPDFFNVMALGSLANVIPRWLAWAKQAAGLPALQDAAYPFPAPRLKFLGTIIQKYRPRKGRPTIGFQSWIDQINHRVVNDVVPALETAGATLSMVDYESVASGNDESFCLCQIPDFNTLIAVSQENQTPVFCLTDEMLGVGNVLVGQQKKREEFRNIFQNLAEKLVGLTTIEDRAESV